MPKSGPGAGPGSALIRIGLDPDMVLIKLAGLGSVRIWDVYPDFYPSRGSWIPDLESRIQQGKISCFTFTFTR
jgi:hypothetical protein